MGLLQYDSEFGVWGVGPRNNPQASSRGRQVQVQVGLHFIRSSRSCCSVSADFASV